MTALISGILTGLVAAAGFFDADPVKVYPGIGQPKQMVVVNFSGDMGLRFLLGASTSRGLTQHGYTAVGITTPALFWRHLSRAEVDQRIADGIRAALARTGARRIVVMGQSYGADVVHVGLAHLPADLRARIAGIVLILPGDTVFYRADPSSLSYHLSPDSIATTTANTLTWAPLTCIYGVEEDDSLCTRMHVPGATLVAMPGGHTINHDADGLLRHVLEAVGRAERRDGR